jgi:uncharacterized protein YfdQ (DUF2303 family)
MGADTQPVFTAAAVQSLAALGARQDIKFLPLPEGALPPDLLVEEPHVAVVYDGKGGVDIRSLKPHIDEARGRPSQRTGTARAKTLESFIDLTCRHKVESSAVFADASWKAPSLTAVIDYHAESDTECATETAGDDPGARFCRHRIHYDFPLSDQWRIWVENNGKVMSQENFAAFLEDHIAEIAAPFPQEEAEVKAKYKTVLGAPLTLLDLSRELEVTVGAKIKSKHRLESGEQAIVFETEHTSTNTRGEAVEVPGMFLIQVPIFDRGEPGRVFARLRYRPAGEQGVLWFYELHRPDLAVAERVDADVERVKNETGLPVYHGAPEA